MLRQAPKRELNGKVAAARARLMRNESLYLGLGKVPQELVGEEWCGERAAL